MSGFPYDTATSFVRHPNGYAHDAFGHTAADDAGVRESCFRKIPHTGIDVSPKVKGDTSTRVVSPIFGTIVATGIDPEAGLWHIIKHDDYPEWWLLGHHSVFAKREGHVDRGDHIANMGKSGGVTGVHVHITVATSLAAALDQIKGYVNLRNGRSVAAWAKTEGLVDPWPLIEREWADEEKKIAEAAAKAEQEEDDMFTDADRAKLNQAAVDAGLARWALTDPETGLRRRLADLNNEIAKLPESTAKAIDVRELAEATEKVAQEITARLGNPAP